MQSKAATVAQYLAELPPDRREALEAVRKVILKSLDKDLEEGMQYGMIGYFVPHRVYPAGYHCDPKQPLPYAGLASQKNHMSLYLGCIYGQGFESQRFITEWARTGKKLDMGKACIRFKRVEDLALDVIADTIRRVNAKKYIAQYEAARESAGKPSGSARSVSKKAPARKATASKATTRKTATKRAPAKKAPARRGTTTKKARTRAS